MKTVIGLFRDRQEAIATISDLKRVGAHDADISVLSSESLDDLAGIRLDAVMIPGMGQVAAGGPLTTFLHTGAAGSSPDLLTAALVRMGIPRGEAVRYVEGVRQGCTLETVSIDDEHAAQALKIMQSHAVSDDLHLDAGQDVRDDTAGIETPRGANAQRDWEERAGRSATVPIIEEELDVSKRAEAAGGVRVETHVKTTPVEEKVELRSERVEVERRRVDRPVTAGDDLFRERSVEVTATTERPVVTKRARVIEEIVLKKDAERRTATIEDTLRRTEADVQDLGGQTASDDSGFREHYDRELAGRATRDDDGSFDYDAYRPAYSFGSGLRGDRRFQGETWDDVEPNARSTWESRNPGTWERMKMAVRHAWERAKG